MCSVLAAAETLHVKYFCSYCLLCQSFEKGWSGRQAHPGLFWVRFGDKQHVYLSGEMMLDLSGHSFVDMKALLSIVHADTYGLRGDQLLTISYQKQTDNVGVSSYSISF